MRGYRKELELSQIQMPLLDFLEFYNQNIPAAFPVASVASLKKFRLLHPILFNKGKMWSTARHRKKLIDWLPSYREEAKEEK